jgi:hypothetical protein
VYVRAIGERKRDVASPWQEERGHWATELSIICLHQWILSSTSDGNTRTPFEALNVDFALMALWFKRESVYPRAMLEPCPRCRCGVGLLMSVAGAAFSSCNTHAPRIISTCLSLPRNGHSWFTYQDGNVKRHGGDRPKRCMYEQRHCANRRTRALFPAAGHPCTKRISNCVTERGSAAAVPAQTDARQQRGRPHAPTARPDPFFGENRGEGQRGDG